MSTYLLIKYQDEQIEGVRRAKGWQGYVDLSEDMQYAIIEWLAEHGVELSIRDVQESMDDEGQFTFDSNDGQVCVYIDGHTAKASICVDGKEHIVVYQTLVLVP